MKINKIKYFMVALILLCCIVGAVSAADDIGQDAIAATDDVVIADQVGDADLQTDEATTDVSSEQSVSTDSPQDTSLEANGADEENLRTSGTATVTNWTQLAGKANSTGIDYTITLNGPINITSENVVFGNNAIIEGNDYSYITGSIGNRIPFKTTYNSPLNITFRNVKFQNINCQMVIHVQNSGTTILDNCTFINITTGNDHHSVVYNNKGIMNITGCNFTNCTTGYGVITNHMYGSTTDVILNVKDSKFENNYALNEPGAINNCGNLTVYNCTFNKNNSTMWAGAIHTHTNAETLIVGSSFNDNVAGVGGPYGWNGGALFSYSTLKVFNSTFTGNNVSVLTGGGAIFGYSMGTSTYNITVDSCNFTNNANNYNGGYAGAIGVQNIGYLTVTNSNFIHNIADIGQAIYGITKNESYCLNCTNCSCPNCPNCTNCSHNVSTGVPNCTIINNTYLNHTGTGDTVVIDGKRFTFNYNIFINSTQSRISGTGNRYGLTTYPSRSSSPILSHQIFSSPILKDWEDHDVIYINRSREADPEDENIHGSSWDDAYGSAYGDFYAFEIAIPCINEGGTIYIAEGTYPEKFRFGNGRSYTMIGMDGTIFDTTEFESPDTKNGALGNYGEEDAGVVTYINITFKNPKVTLRGKKVFINCTFINAPITANQEIYEKFILGNPSGYTPYWTDRTFDFNFTNCNFVNYTTEGAVLEAFKTSQVNFNECTFENVTAKSIVNNTGDFYCEDSINFKDCIFNNVNVKGIVDVPTGAALGVLYTIEGCTGVESYGVVTEDGRDFVNATKSSVDTSLAAAVDADSASAVITLTDIDGNAVVGAVISYSINGADTVNDTTNEAGQIVIAGLSGSGSIAINYEGNDSFNPNSTMLEFTIPEPQNNDTNGTNGTTPVTPTKVATKLAASKVTATYNVAKKLVITLTDKKGKKLANKKVTVKVGSISKTLKTDKNGKVSLNIASLVPKTYTATVKFAGDSSYTASTVKPKVVVNKAKVKIAAKAKTFKVKTKTKKLTATLKNNKGKVMKNTKLTLKVGKKTYTVKTNKKGVATFKITKLNKKGKYTGTIKFAANKYFKALSKKVKITVK